MRKKFDHFMEEVIFPLAEQTNAVIIACAEVEGCVLTKSLTRVFRWMRSRWGQTLPFVLSCTPDIRELYCNPNKKAHWREVRDQCKAWCMIRSTYTRSKSKPCSRNRLLFPPTTKRAAACTCAAAA